AGRAHSLQRVVRAPAPLSFPTRRSSDLASAGGALGIAPGVNDSLAVQVMSDSLQAWRRYLAHDAGAEAPDAAPSDTISGSIRLRSEEHTSELQSRENLVCRLLLEKQKPT